MSALSLSKVAVTVSRIVIGVFFIISGLENGLFTEALLEGLSKKAADENKDGSVSIDELRRYASQSVAALGKDLQHPTVDRDNLSLRLSFVPSAQRSPKQR